MSEDPFDLIRALGDLESRLVATRDKLTHQLSVVRDTKNRVVKQVAALQDYSPGTEGLELLHNAQQLLLEYARQFVRVQGQSVGPSSVETNPGAEVSTPRVAVRARSPRRGRSRRTRTTSVSDTSTKIKMVTVTAPASKVLTDVFSSRHLPKTLEGVMEVVYGVDWSREPLRVLQGRGRLTIVPLAEDLDRGEASQMRHSLQNAIVKIRQFQQGGLPPETRPSSIIRHLSELMSSHSIPSVNSALIAWGIQVSTT